MIKHIVPEYEYWRDLFGRIRCLGDTCVKTKCDYSCPIWINTEAIQFIAQKKYPEAIQAYEEAIALAPDFADAWNNKGMAHGYSDQHDQAFLCYQKAYELAGRNNALFGMAFSKARAGEYLEAFKLCEEYENKFDDGKVSDLKKELEELLGAGNNEKNYMDYLELLLDYAKRKGWIKFDSDDVPVVPELLRYLNICNTFSNQIMEIAEEQGLENTDRMIAVWCALAGAGAVVLWDKDWESLKEKGLEASLLEPRGLDCMDEYVLSLMGIDINDEDAFNVIVTDLTGAYLIVASQVPLNNDNYARQFKEIKIAMYLFGMIMGMARLGMI